MKVPLTSGTWNRPNSKNCPSQQQQQQIFQCLRSQHFFGLICYEPVLVRVHSSEKVNLSEINTNKFILVYLNQPSDPPTQVSLRKGFESLWNPLSRAQNNCMVANTSFRFSWNLSSSFLLVGPQCMSRGRWQVAILFSNHCRRDKYLFSSLWILARKRLNEEKSNFTLAITRNNRWFMAHNSFSSTSSKTRSCFQGKMLLYFRQFRLPTICLSQLIGSLTHAG